jgi:hypothetical protein
MTNPTSNFGWQMPTPTDLVTDLPADFEVFGQAVDTDFADLLGGANGYILSKASATDLDFAWIPNDQGDITAVNVTAPITGGGTAGAVTIGIEAATTSVVGAVQLSDSTSTISSVLAATPTAVKAAYDLAAAAVTLNGTQTLTNKTLTSPTINDPKLNLTLNAQTGTTYTFVLADNGKLITASNASAQTYSIPTNATVAFPIGTQINLIQIGSGQVTVNAVTPGTTSVFSNAATAASPKCRNQYASLTAIKVATDVWYVIGDIA